VSDLPNSNFRLVGTPYVLAGHAQAQVRILQEAFRKALRDPDFHREFKKLSGFDASPLMPEEQDKAIRELPRDRDVVELFKKLAGADPLPPR
jgi:tripartite-type tricarboxylate transporter receptor subunit TctC